jgi:hypothetical protein
MPEPAARLREITPDSPEGRFVLRAYMDDVVSRYWARSGTAAEVDRAELGYQEVPAFNNGPYADHWFEKSLS